MRPVYTSLEEMKTEPIVLGYVGENEHTSVFFDCTEIFAQYPDATPRLMVEPPKGDDYPSITYRQDNFVVWPVTDSDLIYDGEGRCQIEFVEARENESSVVAKTPRARTKVLESIVANGEIPTPVEQWVDRADAKLEEVDQALRTFPAGGNQGAVLTKASDDDYDAEWQEVDLSGKADKADTVLDTTLSRGRDSTSTVGTGSFAFGSNVEASGSYSHANGVDTSASGYGSNAEGSHTEANHAYQHVFGTYNKPDLSNNPSTEKGDYVEIVGNGTSGSAKNNARTLDWAGNEVLAGSLEIGTTFSRGRKSGTTVGDRSFAFGYNVEATETGANAFGYVTKATGSNSFAEGTSSTASGPASHAEGSSNTASGNYSHAEGYGGTASGNSSHTEGFNNTVSGNYSHAEGGSNTVSSSHSHAEGYQNTTSGDTAHSEGYYSKASGSYSHSEGNHTEANHRSQHVFGEYNEPDSSTNASSAKGDFVEIVGNGTSGSAKSNARALDWNGNEYLKGTLKVGCNADSSGGKEVLTLDGLDPLWNSLVSVADFNLWNMAHIKEGYDINQGQWVESDRLDCTETIFPVEPGDYILTATAGPTADGGVRLIRVYTYNEDGTYRWMSVNESFPASGGDISLTFTVASMERGIRISFVPTLSNVVLKKATDITAIDRVARTAVASKVDDVQIGGTSILDNGIATINVSDGRGIIFDSTNMRFSVSPATSSNIKAGTAAFKPIVPSVQHEAAFYGLAKAAGQDMSSSANAVGAYTNAAKAAIQAMLGVESGAAYIETVTGTTPTISGQPNVRYICGEVSTIDITPPSVGTIVVRFSSGSTATVLTLPNTVKFPAWVDLTTLETNTTYEILITDGVYGSVMTWAD